MCIIWDNFKTGGADIDIDWHPGIGDPTFTGCFSVASYFGTAIICWLAHRAARVPARIQQGPSGLYEVHFWRFVAILMTFLGFNKQLDLQTLFTQIGRYFAHVGGWYDQRQTIHMLFIIGLSAVAGMTVFTLLWIFRKLATEIRIASAGLCILVAFIVIRAAFFNHVDWVLGGHMIGLHWNAILELGSIMIVAAAAFLYRNKYQ